MNLLDLQGMTRQCDVGCGLGGFGGGLGGFGGGGAVGGLGIEVPIPLPPLNASFLSLVCCVPFI